MRKPRLDLADLVVTSFDTGSATVDSGTTFTGGPTPDTGCFDCPLEFTRSCDFPCF